MKLWMRLLIGSVIGFFLGLYVPLAGGDSIDALRTIAGIVTSIGRYGLFPLALFGVAIAFFELMSDRLAGKVFAKAGVLIVAASAATVIVSTLLVLLLSPRRIPPIFQEASIPSLPTATSLLLDVFPANLFTVFAQNGSYLLPIAVVAVLLGLLLHREGAQAVPLTDVVDSAARVSFRLNAWIVETLSIGLIAIVSFFVIQLRVVTDLALFGPLLFVTGGIAAFYALILLPGLVYVFCDRYSPFLWLYGLVGPAIVAFFSGDSYFSLGTLKRVLKENFGISRSVSSPVATTATIFAKSGSAMVVAASFLTVLRSYTALGVTPGQVLLVMALSFSVSFVLGSVPGATVLVGLSVLARVFGQGIDEIYLILMPALPLLTAIAVFTDTIAAGFIAFVVAHSERKRRIVDAVDFI